VTDATLHPGGDESALTMMERGFRSGREATKTEAEAYHAEATRLKRGIEFARDTLTGSECPLCVSAVEYLNGLLRGRKIGGTP
jgi:hypothetical protein